MRLLRGLPGDFYGAANDQISVTYNNGKTGKTMTEDFDMVVLSVGMMPSPSHGFFKEILGLSLNEDGFLSVPDEGRNRGIVIAGSAEGPMDVSESITHAKRAALELARYLGLFSQNL
jgi:heterodisulfide reductase subunit A